MATPTVRINQKNLNIRVSAIAGKTLKRIAEKEVRKQVFEPAVNEMISNFENHNITMEIQGGNQAANISETLRGNLRDVGNLYSFIGFEQGDDPIAKIRPFFYENNPGGPKLKYSGSSPKKLVYTFTVSPPDIEQIYANSPLPWADGISWAKRIEVGIAGAGRFLRQLGRGRSGGGQQVKTELGRIRFMPKTYISGILRKFIERVSGRR